MKYFYSRLIASKSKSWHRHLLYLIIFTIVLSGCSITFSEEDEEVNTPQSPSSNSTNTNSPTPTPTDSITETDPEKQIYSKSTELKLRCGQTSNFQNFEITSKCPSQKDGRRDKSIVTFSFLNKSPQHSYLTFEGTVSISFNSGVVDKDYKNYTYFNSKEASVFHSTAKLNPNQAIKIDTVINNVNDEFTFKLGIGKVKIDFAESKTISLKCPDYGIAGDAAYGVGFQLSCLRDMARVHFVNFDNNASQARSVKLEQVQRGILWIYTKTNFPPGTYGGVGVNLLRSSRGESGNYQAQIFSP
ncbi:hypothetical protein VB711_05150 [Cronbergia sp. UHCC 0137]|uniref:hypothetical protein n=1 Tax=Cronbergia sp. UHCC 0137 TaxID=3110239 RepID=UPI002B216F1E|nr:hypothetical protein [Cronbergia sp. UHCC 0137]MEA5617226.1 hypothetical protein [Cronbergia sp. UHCC 0137]